MITKKTVYDGFYANSAKQNDVAKGKIVLNGINANDTYCINNICDMTAKSADDFGIIAGVGSDDKIKYLVQVDLDKKKKRAKINVAALNQTLSAPALNQAIFLSNLPTKKMYSLDVTYKFAQKIERELKQRHDEYYSKELKKNQDKVLSIVNQNNGQHC